MNYKHLQYFWAVARLGGVVKASEHLHVTPQTVSGQIQLLEEHFGRPLFQKKGRKLELTETGQLAFGYAKDIFSLGEELDQVVRQPRGTPRPLELRVGVADAVPKPVACLVLEPALQHRQPFKVICREWKLDSLLAELAVHRLDLVLSDRPLPADMSVQAFNHRLGGSSVGFYASKDLAARLKKGFPACLDGAPLLAPASDSALGMRLGQWLGAHKLKPHIVGEFDDNALPMALGHLGNGVFMAPMVLDATIRAQYGVKRLGEATDLIESYYVITVERRIKHPGVAAITQAARDGLFADWKQ
ncbi:LysR family transcriptional regulator [Aquabacterium sp. NJ1]|uniref:transcriptional activator NhaR n=1 Tax=Aquabacterium sp. NJ1 TaxID=1538295 RepID=UPI00052BFED3|nr:transcriptional activator NhaR [Aquabacterium sp. NJ1]KGM39856.1 LysR family transcriptional regulator [Aquabacterium sp. NJ1]